MEINVKRYHFPNWPAIAELDPTGSFVLFSDVEAVLKEAGEAAELLKWATENDVFIIPDMTLGSSGFVAAKDGVNLVTGDTILAALRALQGKTEQTEPDLD